MQWHAVIISPANVMQIRYRWLEAMPAKQSRQSVRRSGQTVNKAGGDGRQRALVGVLCFFVENIEKTT